VLNGSPERAHYKTEKTRTHALRDKSHTTPHSLQSSPLIPSSSPNRAARDHPPAAPPSPSSALHAPRPCAVVVEELELLLVAPPGTFSSSTPVGHGPLAGESAATLLDGGQIPRMASRWVRTSGNINRSRCPHGQQRHRSSVRALTPPDRAQPRVEKGSMEKKNCKLGRCSFDFTRCIQRSSLEPRVDALRLRSIDL
jgi:hypothetical protein